MSLDKFLEALAVVHKDAAEKGLKKGKGGQSSLLCPICKTGTVTYSVASYNGHICGKCSTENCMRWME